MKEIGQSNRPFVFLDRDGVINRLLVERGPRETPTSATDFQLIPLVREALLSLKEAGFGLIVVTNQPNLAKGKSTQKDVDDIDALMKEQLGANAAIDDLYTCFHHPDAEQVVIPELLQACECRKPAPGLLEAAITKHAIDVNSAWLVGDAVTDIEAGQRVGISNKHLLFIGDQYSDSIHAVKDLWEASQYILTSNS